MLAIDFGLNGWPRSLTWPWATKSAWLMAMRIMRSGRAGCDSVVYFL